MNNLIKKFIYILLPLVFFSNESIIYAAPQEISAEGEYRLGDRDSRETAKMAALADAKRKIIEQVGVFIESYSEVNNLELTKDEIRSTANAMIKTKTEEINFYENGTICKAFVVAVVDVDNIDRFITPKPPEPSNGNLVDKKKYLELGGFKEYNGHYYKIFDENMKWEQAKKRCESMGGYLVTITSKSEQAVIQNLIFLHGNKNFYWTGAVRVSKDEWKWITGEEFSYSNWGNGEPGDYENLIALYKYTGLDGVWFDMSDDESVNFNFYDIKNSGFICEWDSIDDIVL